MSDKEVVDEEYEDLCDAETEVAMYKQAVNYRIAKVKCCETCKNVEYGYEGEVFCKLMDNTRWVVNAVSILGVCDKYEEQE